MTSETPRERKAREKKEFLERAARDEKKRKDNAREEKAWEAAYNEDPNSFTDAAFEREIEGMLGANLNDLYSEVTRGLDREPTNKDVQEGLKAIEEGLKAAKGGWFGGGNKRKALKIFRSNQKKIKKAHQAAKASQSGWCSVVAVLLLTVGGGVLYGAYEGVSALF